MNIILWRDDQQYYDIFCVLDNGMEDFWWQVSFFSGIYSGIPTCPDYWLFIHSKIERNVCECRKTKYASCHDVRNFSTSLECLSLFKVFQHRISNWSNANFLDRRILLPVPSALHQIPINQNISNISLELFITLTKFTNFQGLLIVCCIEPWTPWTW